MPNYIRAKVPGGSYFFTVVLLDRRQHLLTERIDDLRCAVRTVRAAHPFRIDAMVVLPEHLHCVWTLPRGDADFSTRWRLIKTAFARAVDRGERLPGRHLRARERGIWQRRFWEHVIRDEADLRRHVDYIHFNPVKHGWVSRVAEWPHSSLHRFARDGVYAVDWGGDEGAEELDLE